jgi:histidinol-phosphate aminotransferase
VAPADVAAACLKVKNTFDVSQVAADAALASLDARDEIARRRAENAAGRERLVNGLRRAGLEPLPSVANFVYVPVGDGAALAAALEREGVIVRPLGGFGAPDAIRVTVGHPHEIDAFLAALEACRARVD